VLIAIKRWLIIAGAFILAVIGALLAGKRSGRNAAERDAVVDAAAVQKNVINVRGDVDAEISSGGAGSSADKLRNDWMRDEGDGKP